MHLRECGILLDSDGIYHSPGFHDSHADESDSALLKLGTDTAQKTKEDLQALCSKADEPGMNVGSLLNSVLHEFQNILRFRLGNDPPCIVLQMAMPLKKGDIHHCAKPRRYSDQQCQVLLTFIEVAEKYGYMEKNPLAQWCENQGLRSPDYI